MTDDKSFPVGKHPNSLANLKPAKPGEVRNPEGARSHDPAMRELRKFTSEYLADVIETCILGNLADLAAIANDPSTPAIKVGVARVLYNGIEAGNWDVVEKILARVIGKVPDKFDHTSGGKSLNSGNLAVTFVRAMQANHDGK